MSDLRQRLSSVQGRNDQEPNKSLALEITKSGDTKAISELIALLKDQDQKIVFDVLKVLEVIGDHDPQLVKMSFPSLIPLISHTKNMIAWMAMGALCHIAHLHPEETLKHLPQILKIMDGGSVITRDKGMIILIGLYVQDQKEIAPLIVEQILKAPDNQFGQYTEKWLDQIKPEDLSKLEQILEVRTAELQHPSHIKRAKKNLSKVRKLKLRLS